MPDGSAPIQGARPSVEVDGQRVTTLSSSLSRLDIVDTADGLAHCELEFGNWGGPEHGGFQHFDRTQLEFGKTLTVRVGSDALFEGRISAILAHYPDGGPPRVGIMAEDRLQQMRMTRRTRCFTNVGLADLVNRIAGEHAMTGQTDLDGPQHRVLAQANQSDLAFLRDLARREDAQIWAEGTTLKAANRRKRQGGTVSLAWAGPLREFTVSADLAHQRTALTVGGWNVSAKDRLAEQADEGAIRQEVGPGEDSGPAMLRRALGARPDTIAHSVAFDVSEARALADASMRHLARRFVTGYGVAETRATLKVGAKLRLSGLGPLFNGDYTAIAVHHRFDARLGLRTEFSCDRASVGTGR